MLQQIIMELKNIPINNIEIYENIRQHKLGKEQVELMASIKENGLMQPIGVQQVNGTYVLIYGYRRLDACKKLGHKTIAVYVMKKGKDIDKKEFFILNATENLQRKDITPFELGRIINFLKENYKMTNGEIAVRLSLSHKRIQDCSSIFNRVPKKYIDKIAFTTGGVNSRKGNIPVGVATAVSQLRIDNKSREKIFKWVNEKDITDDKIKIVRDLINFEKNIDKILTIAEEYHSNNFRMLFNKKIYQKLKVNNQTEFIKNIINEKYPNLIY